MASNQKQQQQLAVALSIMAKELGAGYAQDQLANTARKAEHDQIGTTRREKVIELCKLTADGSEAAAVNGTPLQVAFIGMFQKEAWTASGRTGEVNLNGFKGGWSGLGVISSNIKSILCAANIAKMRVLTESHHDSRASTTTPWDAEQYLYRAKSWADLYASSVEIRKAAARASVIPEDAAPKDRTARTGKKITAKAKETTWSLVHQVLQSASDGRVLIEEALRCFIGTAPTVEAKTAIRTETDKYLETVNRYLEPIRNEKGLPAKKQDAGNASAAAVAAPTQHVAPNAPGNDELALLREQMAAMANMLAKVTQHVPAALPPVDQLAAFQQASAQAKAEADAAVKKAVKRGRKAA